MADQVIWNNSSTEDNGKIGSKHILKSTKVLVRQENYQASIHGRIEAVVTGIFFSRGWLPILWWLNMKLRSIFDNEVSKRHTGVLVGQMRINSGDFTHTGLRSQILLHQKSQGKADSLANIDKQTNGIEQRAQKQTSVHKDT